MANFDTESERKFDVLSKNGIIPTEWRSSAYHRALCASYEDMAVDAGIPPEMLFKRHGNTNGVLLEPFMDMMSSKNCRGMIICRTLVKSNINLDIELSKLRAIAIRRHSTRFCTLNEALESANESKPMYRYEFVTSIFDKPQKGISVSDYVSYRNRKDGFKTIFLCDSYNKFRSSLQDVAAMVSCSWKVVQ